jgi:hypothetical protein
MDTILDNVIDEHYLGSMDQICPHCQARFWSQERTQAGNYTTCCSNGKVKLNPITPPTDLMNELFQGNTSRSKAFLKKSRQFNTKCSFASVSLNEYQFRTHVIPTIRISGQVYHRLGAIHPEPHICSLYLCKYFFTNTTER